MSLYRLKLSDGTTTIDLYGGSDSIVREGGLSMPPPRARASYIPSQYSDGSRLGASTYDNRIITVTTRIWGTTLADLKTNIRTIQRLLNDAEKRNLLGYGAQVYLEYQWGDTAGESTYFDVLRGDLAMPTDYLNVHLDNYFVRNATITLTCKPFGRYTNQDITQDTLENDNYATASTYNYQDVTISSDPEAYGDTPAKMYMKIALDNAVGAKKMWIAKRSGVRYDDDLWMQGEDEDGYASLGGTGVDSVSVSDVTATTESGNQYLRTSIVTNAAASVHADTDIAYSYYDIASAPRGQFRVLNYCRVDSDIAAEYDHMGWGVGWSYGDKTYAPTEVKGEYYACAADDTWEVLDLGLLNIPPIAESDIAENSTFQLRVYQHAINPLSPGNRVNDWESDYLFLLPIDEGTVIIDSVGSSDVLGVDGITDPNNVFIMSSGDDIEDYPDYVGAPFTLGRENTRIYVLRDDVKGVTFTTDIKYQPQFLLI